MKPTDPFEALVAEFYRPLFRFAMSLTRSEFDARDLTQQTFYIWATKGHQLRDSSKVKAWLFTTLHRVFLLGRRRRSSFSEQNLEEVSGELPALAPDFVGQGDCAQVLLALASVDEMFQAPVALFYLEDCSYKEIAAIVGVPLGTVKSRISRGIEQLRKALLGKPQAAPAPWRERTRSLQQAPASGPALPIEAPARPRLGWAAPTFDQLATLSAGS